nr:MAG TPA: hypothetical protein [Microviridae sp.]
MGYFFGKRGFPWYLCSVTIKQVKSWEQLCY